MRASLPSILFLHAVLGVASPTAPTVPGRPAAAQADKESTTNRNGNGAAAANDFLALVEGWQHRRASGYYVLADACGDVITEYHEPRHVKLGGCDVTQCAEELRDEEADATMERRMAPSSSVSSKWCTSRSAIRPADPVTSLMGHLRCLASLPQKTYDETPGTCRTCRHVVMEKWVPYRGQTVGRCYAQPVKRPQRPRPLWQRPLEKVAESEPEAPLELRR